MDGKRPAAGTAGIPRMPPSKRVHPGEEPVEVMTRLIGKWCSPSGLVVDLFCGSGPVLEAAQRLGRRAVGIEVEQQDCTATARLKAV